MPRRVRYSVGILLKVPVGDHPRRPSGCGTAPLWPRLTSASTGTPERTSSGLQPGVYFSLAFRNLIRVQYSPHSLWLNCLEQRFQLGGEQFRIETLFESLHRVAVGVQEANIGQAHDRELLG